jgi:P27 family predicted phage terminase small subunit
MPSTLPQAARPAWRWLVRLLTRMRVITKADGPILLLAACRLADHERLRGIIEREGETFETVTEKGSTMVRTRPEVQLRDVAWRDAVQALSQLGLTPAMRAKVSVTSSPQDQPSELESFLARR